MHSGIPSWAPARDLSRDLSLSKGGQPFGILQKNADLQVFDLPGIGINNGLCVSLCVFVLISHTSV